MQFIVVGCSKCCVKMKVQLKKINLIRMGKHSKSYQSRDVWTAWLRIIILDLHPVVRSMGKAFHTAVHALIKTKSIAQFE